MKKFSMYAYNNNSLSSKDLSRELGISRIKHQYSRFKGSDKRVVLNWGSTNPSEEVMKCVVLNHPDAIKKACDKRLFFQSHKSVIDSTTNRDVAQGWCDDGFAVVERHVLNGHSGNGVVITEHGLIVGEALLYTKYMPKKFEYRVHVFDGNVIDCQKKVRNKCVPDDKVNWKVRNHSGGFIFARNEALGIVPQSVKDEAVRVVGELGLLFGAADVLYNEAKGIAAVVEVNTAPGLTGTTLEVYTRVISEYVKGL